MKPLFPRLAAREPLVLAAVLAAPLVHAAPASTAPTPQPTATPASDAPATSPGAAAAPPASRDRDAGATTAAPDPSRETAAPVVANPSPSSGGAGADDLGDIQAALAADAQQSSQSGSATPSSAASVAPSGSGGVQSLNPDVSLIADFAAAAFSSADPLQAGAHDPKHNGFNLQALELSLASAVDPYLRFDSHITFDLEGVDVEEAYGTTLGLPFRLQARLGQFLSRFGRLNASHPHTWNLSDQPFALSRVFGGEGNKGLGVELSWLTPLPWYVELVGSTMMADGAQSSRSFLGDSPRRVSGLEDLEYMAAAKQFFPLSDDWSLAWGLSGMFGPNPSGPGNRSAIYGSDVYLKYRPITRESFTIVSLTSEWFYRRRQVPSDIIQDVSSYSELFWRFAQRWAAAARYEYGSPPLSVHGGKVQDPLDPAWVDTRHRVALALSHYPSEFSRFRLQVSRDMPGYRDAIWAGFLTAELAIGAHGAHAF